MTVPDAEDDEISDENRERTVDPTDLLEDASVFATMSDYKTRPLCFKTFEKMEGSAHN
jgi:hypothetical protein